MTWFIQSRLCTRRVRRRRARKTPKRTLSASACHSSELRNVGSSVDYQYVLMEQGVAWLVGENQMCFSLIYTARGTRR